MFTVLSFLQSKKDRMKNLLICIPFYAHVLCISLFLCMGLVNNSDLRLTLHFIPHPCQAGCFPKSLSSCFFPFKSFPTKSLGTGDRMNQSSTEFLSFKKEKLKLVFVWFHVSRMATKPEINGLSHLI
uniref:Uncharacterized protein n=1 Tax=Micrurus lemniscatus lemniscatus TaxID=129467 RepID=A0A2D4ICD3_MICLE